jgi:VanZ family protein
LTRFRGSKTLRPDEVAHVLDTQLLAAVPTMVTDAERRKARRRLLILTLLVACVAAAITWWWLLRR